MAVRSMAKAAIHKYCHALRPKHKVRPHGEFRDEACVLSDGSPLLLRFTTSLTSQPDVLAPSSRHLTAPLLHFSTFTFTCLFHPVIPAACISPASFCSVSLFPVERIRDITSERLALENTSDMAPA